MAPDTRPAMHAAFTHAVRAAGGRTAALQEARALVWADPARPHLYPETIAAAPNVEWVQLPYAGIEVFSDYLDGDRIWTCGNGVYADPVAEYVMAAMLWRIPNCIITPHVGNTPEMGLPLIAGRVRENVSLWLAGEELIGRVDVDLGY